MLECMFDYSIFRLYHRFTLARSSVTGPWQLILFQHSSDPFLHQCSRGTYNRQTFFLYQATNKYLVSYSRYADAYLPLISKLRRDEERRLAVDVLRPPDVVVCRDHCFTGRTRDSNGGGFAQESGKVRSLPLDPRAKLIHLSTDSGRALGIRATTPPASEPSMISDRICGKV